MVNVKINGIQVAVPENATILQAAEAAGVKIPTLCHHPDQAIKANCRICVCEVEGLALLQAACSTPVWDGMVVKTNNPAVLEARKTILELILAHHPQDCLNCIRNQNCELQTLAEAYQIRKIPLNILPEVAPGYLHSILGARPGKMHFVPALRICLQRNSDCQCPGIGKPGPSCHGGTCLRQGPGRAHVSCAASVFTPAP